MLPAAVNLDGIAGVIDQHLTKTPWIAMQIALDTGVNQNRVEVFLRCLLAIMLLKLFRTDFKSKSIFSILSFPASIWRNPESHR